MLFTSLRRDLEIAALVTIIVTSFLIILDQFQIKIFTYKYIKGNIKFCFYFVCLYFCLKLLFFIASEKPERIFYTINKKYINKSSFIELISAFIIITCFAIFMPIFGAIKSTIPVINSFSWDDKFIYLDRLIHGKDPWIIIHNIFGFPFITSALSAFYHFWVIMLYIFLVYFAFRQKDPSLRQQFFLAFFLCWSVIGVALATFFSSVGPCFVGPILGMSDFDPLMAYLAEANNSYPVLVLPVQQALLNAYQRGDFGLGLGITAMPSMHVSVAFLFVLSLRSVSRLAFYSAIVFFIMISIGSVHLGYHYAIDGYAAIIATALIWKFCGWWSKRTLEHSLDSALEARNHVEVRTK